MDKLNKTFVHGQVLRTEEMQAIVDKIDEIISSSGGGGTDIELSEAEWAALTNNDTDYSGIVEGVKYFIYEDNGGGSTDTKKAVYDTETNVLTLYGTYADGVLTLNGEYNEETNTLNI